MATDDLLLPSGAVLLHIGPYKTGTTALQASLAQHRADLRRHGVLYPGEGRRQLREVMALIGNAVLPGLRDVSPREWDDLLDEVRRVGAERVVISSEDLSTLDREQATRAVGDLGGEHVHVLTVARNLAALLPSSWQERVKSVNETRSYEEFLRDVLAPDADGPVARVFWRHHSLASLLGVWSSAVAPDRVTVVVADESDHTQLRCLCERMLGLPDGFLTVGSAANTSLTWNRAELYRALNRRVADGAWDERTHRRLVYGALLPGLVTAPPSIGEVPIPALPAWAVERLRELGDERVRQLAEAGVRVVGDPERLREPPEVGEGMPVTPEAVSVEAAVAGLAGLLEAVERRRSRRDRKAKGDVP